MGAKQLFIFFQQRTWFREWFDSVIFASLFSSSISLRHLFCERCSFRSFAFHVFDHIVEALHKVGRIFLYILFFCFTCFNFYLSTMYHGKEKEKGNGTRCSQAVTHPSTDRARRCLTSVIGREPVYSTWYGRYPKDIPGFPTKAWTEKRKTISTKMSKYNQPQF